MTEDVPIIGRISVLLAEETDDETCTFRLIIIGIYFFFFFIKPNQFIGDKLFHLLFLGYIFDLLDDCLKSKTESSLPRLHGGSVLLVPFTAAATGVVVSTTSYIPVSVSRVPSYGFLATLFRVLSSSLARAHLC